MNEERKEGMNKVTINYPPSFLLLCSQLSDISSAREGVILMRYDEDFESGSGVASETVPL